MGTNTEKTKQRLFRFVMAIALACMLVPVGAFAQGARQEAAAQDEGNQQQTLVAGEPQSSEYSFPAINKMVKVNPEGGTAPATEFSFDIVGGKYTKPGETTGPSDGDSSGGGALAMAEGDVPVPNPSTVTTTGAGEAYFGSVIFENSGTYTYTVTEQAGSAANWTYDSTEYTLTVVVNDDLSTSSIISGGKNTFDFTNIYKVPTPPASETVSHSVTKTWAGENYQDTRPSAVSVELYCDGSPTGKTTTLTAESEWMYTWNELEANKADGTAHKYTAKENEPVNYRATYDNTNSETTAITNTFDIWLFPQVTKEADKAIANPGDVITYTITVENATDVAMHGVWVKDYLPAETIFISCDPVGEYGQSDSKQYINWFVKKLDGRQTVVFKVLLRVADEAPEGSRITNRALYTLLGTEEEPDFTTDPVGGETPPTASTEVGPKTPTGATALVAKSAAAKATTAKTADGLMSVIPWLTIMALGGALLCRVILRERSKKNEKGRIND